MEKRTVSIYSDDYEKLYSLQKKPTEKSIADTIKRILKEREENDGWI